MALPCDFFAPSNRRIPLRPPFRRPAPGRRPRSPPGAAVATAKPGSSFTALTRAVHDMGSDAPPVRLLLGQADRVRAAPRRLGGGLRLDRRFVVATGECRGARCDDDPDRVSRPRCRPPADVQVRPLERLGQPDRRESAGRDQLRLVAEQAHPPPRQPEQGGRRPRYRLKGDRDDPGDGDPAPQPAAAVAGRSPGLVLLPDAAARGLSLHADGIKRVFSRGKVERRWVEIAFLTVRLGGLAALVFAVLPPGKAVGLPAVQLAVFGLYMGSSFAPNHIGMPLVSPKLKLDFLRRQVLMSRNVTGGPLMSIFMGGLNYQVEHHLFPSMARPHLRKIQPLVAAYCAAEGVPYTQTTLWQSYRTVIGYLNTVGLKGKDPFLCPLVAQRRAL